MVFLWFRHAMEYVTNTEHHQCQTIYATNQDKKDVVCVVVFLILKQFFVHVAKQSLEQNPEAKEYGINWDDTIWRKLKVNQTGTRIS
jgi:hypothetical protein